VNIKPHALSHLSDAQENADQELKPRSSPGGPDSGHKSSKQEISDTSPLQQDHPTIPDSFTRESATIRGVSVAAGIGSIAVGD